MEAREGRMRMRKLCPRSSLLLGRLWASWTIPRGVYAELERIELLKSSISNPIPVLGPYVAIDAKYITYATETTRSLILERIRSFIYTPEIAQPNVRLEYKRQQVLWPARPDPREMRKPPPRLVTALRCLRCHWMVWSSPLLL